MIKNDEYYMHQALKQAHIAYNKNEVPVGCCIVYNDEIISKSHNLKETTNLPTKHAEIIAIEKACKKLNAKVLVDCTMYVTLEPCAMCAGALLNSRIKRVVYATEEPKFGAVSSVINIFDNPKFNHQIEITKGILQEESSKLLKNFFQKLRQNHKNML